MAQLNTQWAVEADVFKMSATTKDGTELLDSYCVECPNQHMLLLWGIYLDGNSNDARKAGDISIADCGSLQSPTAAALSLSGGMEAALQDHAKGISPACTVSDPKRCNLAKLAFELCGETWL